MTEDGKDFEGMTVSSGRVEPAWIDVNHHMNVAYYVLAFDRGVDALWNQFGITDQYIEQQRNSTFAVETHITYQRELRLDERYIITSQILAYDAKRIHQFMRMYHAEERYLAATAEWMNLHVDLDTRRVAPWPDDILANIQALATGQTFGQRPTEAGSRMQVPTPYWSVEDYSW
jgi:acyl-CoA thioester hydrolase